jgi:DNA-binding PadR family transcriptional regulator
MPFGDIQRSTTTTKVFLKEWKLKSTIIVQWHPFARYFGDILKKHKALIDTLTRAIISPNKEITISKADFESSEALLADLDNAWMNFLGKKIPPVLSKFKKWEGNSRRGFFRLLIIFSILLLKKEKSKEGLKLMKKGLGGAIKKKMIQHSGGLLEIRGGSLYKALNVLEKSNVIRNYKKNLENGDGVLVSKKGKSLFIKILAYLLDFYKALNNLKIFSKINQSTIDDVIRILKEKDSRTTPSIKLGDIQSKIDLLDAYILKFKSNPDYTDLEEISDVTILDDWKTNINRGLVDVFILGKFFMEPSYGNAIIAGASESLQFQAGTLYPRLKIFLERYKFIEKLSDEESQEIMGKSDFSTQGPSKVFYRITILGAFYFCFMVTILLSDLNTVLNMVNDFKGLEGDTTETKG